MATFNRIRHQVTKLKSSQAGFLDMTLSSHYSDGLHIQQTSIQLSTSGMWGNGRFIDFSYGCAADESAVTV